MNDTENPKTPAQDNPHDVEALVELTPQQVFEEMDAVIPEVLPPTEKPRDLIVFVSFVPGPALKELPPPGKCEEFMYPMTQDGLRVNMENLAHAQTGVLLEDAVHQVVAHLDVGLLFTPKTPSETMGETDVVYPVEPYAKTARGTTVWACKDLGVAFGRDQLADGTEEIISDADLLERSIPHCLMAALEKRGNVPKPSRMEGRIGIPVTGELRRALINSWTEIVVPGEVKE